MILICTPQRVEVNEKVRNEDEEQHGTKRLRVCLV
jgi:hypothetical protein